MKTPTEIATSLEFFNEWRRKDEFITTKMPDPYEVGHDIDMAVMLLREHDATTAERDQLRAEFEKIAVIAAQTQDRNVSLKIERKQLRAERDQLRADCENETKWAAHYLAQSIADKARAERAEAELATERARLDRRFSRDEKSSIAHALDHLIENKVADEGRSGGWYCGNRKKFEERHRKSLAFMRSLLLPNELAVDSAMKQDAK